MSSRILIVDSIATNRLVLQVKLKAARYETMLAATAEEALEIARADQPDLILMDVNMPHTDGVAACRRFKDTPELADVPIILFTAINDAQARIAGLAAGADDFLAKPIEEVPLLARVRSLLRSRDQIKELRLREATCAELGFTEGSETSSAPRATVVVLSETSQRSQKWADALSLHLQDKVVVSDRDAVLSAEAEAGPDLIVIGMRADEQTEGLRLLADLRCRAATRHASIIAVLPQSDSDLAATVLDLGASDICYQPYLSEEMALRVRTQLSRKRRADRLRAILDDGLRLAVTDTLTGLYNRRYGIRHLGKVAERAQASGGAAALIMVDVDDFKGVNDTHGHGVGDRVLTAIAKGLKTTLRAEDMICRLGGEEFLAILPDISLRQAHKVAERMRETIAALRLPIEGKDHLHVTASLGVAAVQAEGYDVECALRAADRALYAAKDAGRNRTVVEDGALLASDLGYSQTSG